MKAVHARPMSLFLPPRHALAPAMFATLTLSMLFAFSAQPAEPVVSNVRASQRYGTRLVDVYYDLAATSACGVSVTFSTNSGSTYSLAPSTLSGDAGNGVPAGANKHIVWDAGADWAGQYSALMRVKVTADDSGSVIPPDPATVATAPSNGVVTLLGDSTAFLYTGSNPIQTGMTTGTIAALRSAVLRGRVLDQAGATVAGVMVTIEGHGEYGQTLTRTNGMYDMAVNGGSALNVTFSKSGYLAAQRTVDVPWQEYVILDDVMMKQADTNVTHLTLRGRNMKRDNPEMLVARGSLSGDGDGERRALVMLPDNVGASVLTAGGGTQEITTLHGIHGGLERPGVNARRTA